MTSARVPDSTVFIASMQGHRRHYTRFVLDCARDRGVPTRAYSFDASGNTMGVDTLPSPATSWKRFRILYNVARDSGSMILLEADFSWVEMAVLLAVAYRRPAIPTSALVMRPPSRRQRLAALPSLKVVAKLLILWAASVPPHIRIHVLDDATRSWSSSRRSVMTRRWQAIGDPIELTPEELPPEIEPSMPRPWLLCAGYLCARKNIRLIIDSWRGAGSVGTLIVAGEADAETSDLLNRTHDTRGLVRIPRRVTNGELDRLVIECDAVLAMYDNAAPSGLVGKAVLAGTFVIGSSIPQIERLSRTRAIAVSLTAKELRSILSALPPERPTDQTGLVISSPMGFGSQLLGLSVGENGDTHP